MRRSLAPALALLLAAGGALAQTRPPPGGFVEPRGPRADFLRRFGAAGASRLLSSPDPAERERGVVRLGVIGTPDAVSSLVSFSEALREGDVRLKHAVVLALAPHAADDVVRRVLVRALRDGVVCAERACSVDPRVGEALARTAALALARHGRKEGAEHLFAASRRGGLEAQAARDALLAHPPVELPIASPLDAKTASLLGELGDLRAVPLLVEAMQRGEAPARAEALVALARLGHADAAAVARHWARSPDPAGRLAAARALRFASPREASAVAASIDDPALARVAALAVAEVADGALAPTLLAIARDEAAASVMRGDALVGLERARAFDALQSLFDGPLAKGAAAAWGESAPLDVVAASLRAGGSGSAALGALVRLAIDPSAKLSSDDPRLVLARAPDKELEAALDDPARRGLAAQLLAIRGRSGALVRRLAGADVELAVALGVGLADHPDAPGVPTEKLVSWVDDGTPLAPLATLALARRSEPAGIALLGSSDPELRRHAAMGLVASQADGVDGKLLSALSRELEPSVRRAVARTLGLRASSLAASALAACRDLDPDRETRQACSAPARGTRGGRRVVLVSGPAGKAARFVRADGLIVPLLLGADGIAVVATPFAAAGRASVTP